MTVQYCAPNRANGMSIESHYTCFTVDELREIAKTYNSFVVKNRICKDEICSAENNLIKSIKTKSKRELWNDIYNRLKSICRYEWCWLDLNFINNIKDEDFKRKLKYFTFKPKMTPGRYDWLSTSDINFVLKQYESTKNRKFLFLGAQPADFIRFTDLHFNNLKTYNCVGIVFNLDTHNKPGSHWVSMVIDNNNKTLEYFDSLGERPNKHIREFIKLLLKKTQFKHYTFSVNKKVHQKENSECGVYAINFILQKLEGKSFEDITNNIVLDDQINKLRDHLFRPRD